jgi:hypothetical protein
LIIEEGNRKGMGMGWEWEKEKEIGKRKCKVPEL